MRSLRSGTNVRLYLDEDLSSKELVARLESAGHELVPTVRGEPDGNVWAHAQTMRAAVITQNARDFERLALAAPRHHGLLLVYRENDPLRDMTPARLANAIDRLATTWAAGVADLILTLNAFR